MSGAYIPKTAMFIFAHPDDEALGLTIKQELEEGVCCLFLSLVQIICVRVHGSPFPDWVFAVRGCLVIP